MDIPAELDRYHRQILFSGINVAGQRRICQGRVLICGAGALGSVAADLLVRAGVGLVRLADRDYVEWHNLQRQVLYDEQDVQQGLPKAIAAQRKLQRINSQVEVDARVVDVNHRNIRSLAADVDMIVDGTDNFETRFLLNDFALHSGTPWVYGGCIGAEGQTMTILPGETPCLRCLMSDTPPPGTTPTCDTAGILGPIVNVIASMEACETLKILSGNREAVSRTLNVIDLWDNRLRQIGLQALYQAPDGQTGPCPACHGREFPWLEGQRGQSTVVLCGRNAVQLSPPQERELNLKTLADKLRGVGVVTLNPYLLRFEADGYRVTVFPDGRAIVTGTEDETEARSVYARYIGN